MRVINFFPMFINHTKGAGIAGTPFHLAPFQQFTQYNLFGWKKKSDNLRRIKTIYDKRGKKNGKTAELAGAAIYVMADDDENEAEVYVSATSQKQAKLCWEQAKNFIDSPLANPILKQIGFETRLSEIRFSGNGSTMKALTKENGGNHDGVNCHFGIIDEYHAYNSDAIKENLETSSVMRSQPILYHVTTAGTNIQSVCYNYEEVCKGVLMGTNEEDDTLWIMIHEMDDGDDWQDPENWYKCNPLLGQGLTMDRLKEDYHKCVLQPSKKRMFKTKNLNMWVDEQDPWIENEVWMQNSDKVKIENFIKYGCYGAIDLSTTTDLTCTGFLSNPDEEGIQDFLVLVFCPKDTIDKRSKEDRVPYRHWSETNMIDYVEVPKHLEADFSHLIKDLKLLIATEGNVVDYNVMEDYSKKYYFLLKCLAFLFDRYNSTQLVTNLIESGLEMLQFAQTTTYFSTPTKEIEKLSLSGKLRHGGNPLLQWCLTGCGTYIDPNENVRLSKKHSTKRIDPLITLVMAEAGVLNTEEPETSESIYNNPDVDFYA